MPSGNEVQGFSSISGRAEEAKFSRCAAFALEQSSDNEPPKNENRYGIICLDNPADASFPDLAPTDFSAGLPWFPGSGVYGRRPPDARLLVHRPTETLDGFIVRSR